MSKTMALAPESLAAKRGGTLRKPCLGRDNNSLGIRLLKQATQATSGFKLCQDLAGCCCFEAADFKYGNLIVPREMDDIELGWREFEGGKCFQFPNWGERNLP